MPRVHRRIIGIFGRINAGKSTLMNLVTGQETSIVDPAPGTTADIKSALMEIHATGPVRLLDTAGLDEESGLGGKKRRKTLTALEEVDLALLVIDPVQTLLSGELEVERLVASLSRKLSRQLGVVFNVRADSGARLETTGATIGEAIEFSRSALADRAGTPSIEMDLQDSGSAVALTSFISRTLSPDEGAVELLPFVDRSGPVLLHVPLDEESPEGRLLRPQEMAMEFLLRLGVPVGLYRTDLVLARSASPVLSTRERGEFRRFLDSLGHAEPVQLVLTDSQAIDVMNRWVPSEVALTTFSIMMMHSTSGGDLTPFIEGAEALDRLKPGDRVLIAEACNHDRIAEDIGTVQIPRLLRTACPDVAVEHAFGREFPDPDVLSGFSVVIHCGGCMISTQKLQARTGRLRAAGVPVTNYGMVLSWLQSPETLKRVLEPWRRDLS